MNLPALRYECLHCGYSCRGLQVELSPETAQRLTERHPQAVRQDGERSWLRKNDDGSCHFLLPDGPGRCALHRQEGAEAKPSACRDFPFQVRETPGGTFLGASFACRAIATGHGPPVSEAPPKVSVASRTDWPLAPGVPFDWDRYLRWEQTVSARLAQGPAGLWAAALEVTEELRGGPRGFDQQAEEALSAAFRGLLALAEGPLDPSELWVFLTAHQQGGRYPSQLLGREVDVGRIQGEWREPWPDWPLFQEFFSHLLFRKSLLDGPDVHSRLCSLPLLAQILQFLMLASEPYEDPRSASLQALRTLEERLTFHARGLEGYLGRVGQAFLNLPPRRDPRSPGL